MKLARAHKSSGMTLVELLVVLVVVFALLMLLPPAVVHDHATHSPRMECMNNLRQIGVASTMWADDHSQRFPASESVSNGGWSDLLAKPNAGHMCWTNYAIMSNYFGPSTKVLVCPADERNPADNFSNLISNANVSYFVGLANISKSESLLGGDRNLGPGIVPDKEYGFSPGNGAGNDVVIQSDPKNDPICWSLKTHSLAIKTGAGNILLADSSVHTCTSVELRQTWQPSFCPAATRLPEAPSIRVLFP